MNFNSLNFSKNKQYSTEHNHYGLVDNADVLNEINQYPTDKEKVIGLGTVVRDGVFSRSDGAPNIIVDYSEHKEIYDDYYQDILKGMRGHMNWVMFPRVTKNVVEKRMRLAKRPFRQSRPLPSADGSQVENLSYRMEEGVRCNPEHLLLAFAALLEAKSGPGSVEIVTGTRVNQHHADDIESRDFCVYRGLYGRDKPLIYDPRDGYFGPPDGGLWNYAAAFDTYRNEPTEPTLRTIGQAAIVHLDDYRNKKQHG